MQMEWSICKEWKGEKKCVNILMFLEREWMRECLDKQEQHHHIWQYGYVDINVCVFKYGERERERDECFLKLWMIRGRAVAMAVINDEFSVIFVSR